MAVQVSLSVPDNHPRTELANGWTLAPLARQRPDVSPASELFLDKHPISHCLTINSPQRSSKRKK
jgi:hypothetical protein